MDRWLADDVPTFDVGGFVVGDAVVSARLLGKSEGIIAGVPFVDAVFRRLGCAVKWHAKEGDEVRPVHHVATVTGPCRKVLLGERTALNILARASGLATRCAKAAQLKRDREWAGEVVGTRKVTPGFRLVEKYALLVGGCGTHRMDLSHMVMLKDNHVWATGSIRGAVGAARAACGFASKIEVECRSLEEAREACGAGCDVCMLDNFTPAQLEEQAPLLKKEFPHVVLEVSGGLTPDNAGPYMLPCVDVVSMGCLTQGYGVVDFSLKVDRGSGVEAVQEAAARAARLGVEVTQGLEEEEEAAKET